MFDVDFNFIILVRWACIGLLSYRSLQDTIAGKPKQEQIVVFNSGEPPITLIILIVSCEALVTKKTLIPDASLCYAEGVIWIFFWKIQLILHRFLVCLLPLPPATITLKRQKQSTMRQCRQRWIYVQNALTWAFTGLLHPHMCRCYTNYTAGQLGLQQ